MKAYNLKKDVLIPKSDRTPFVYDSFNNTFSGTLLIPEFGIVTIILEDGMKVKTMNLMKELEMDDE